MKMIFRGKKKNIAEQSWVYGDLLHYNDNYARIREEPIGFASEVFVDTVCMSTTKLDRNHIEIYENDICVCHFPHLDPPNDMMTGYIKWVDCGFELIDPSTKTRVSLGVVQSDQIDIIGNLFDAAQAIKKEEE